MSINREMHNKPDIDMSEQKENIQGSVLEFEKAKKSINNNIAQNQQASKNGMA